MVIKEIKIDKFPIVLISDVHCEIYKVRRIKSLYPHYKFICLGDIVDLYCKDVRNKLTIQYFIDNDILTLEGNHDSHVSGVVNGNTILFLDNTNNIDIDYYKLPKHQGEYLKNLPRGFKLTLPDGKNYLLYHHFPLDLWGFIDKGKLTKEKFISDYNIDDTIESVIHGHLHQAFVEEFEGLNAKRISIGAVKFGEYAILDESGVHFKKLN